MRQESCACGPVPGKKRTGKTQKTSLYLKASAVWACTEKIFKCPMNEARMTEVSTLFKGDFLQMNDFLKNLFSS